MQKVSQLWVLPGFNGKRGKSHQFPSTGGPLDLRNTFWCEIHGTISHPRLVQLKWIRWSLPKHSEELGDVVPFNLSVGIFSHTISSHHSIYIYIYVYIYIYIYIIWCYVYITYIYISISHWICWQETAMILPIRFFTPRPQKKSRKVPAPVCPVWTPTSCRSCSRGTTWNGDFFWWSIMET